MHSLMQAIEDIIRANADLERANSAGNLDDIDDAVADMDYYIAQLCQTVGLDKRTVERAA